MSNQQFLYLQPQQYEKSVIAKMINSTTDLYFIEVLQFMQLWIIGSTEFKFNTSGSTGKPKVVLHNRAMMVLSAKNTIQALQLKREDVALACMDVNFIGGAMMVVRALVNQMPLIVVKPGKNPLASTIPQFDFTAMVPLQLQTIKETNDEHQINQLQNCKVVILGGSQVNSSLIPWIKTLKCRIFETYGMTETVSHVAIKQLNGEGSNDQFKGVGNILFSADAEDKLQLMGSITNNKWLITNDIVQLFSENEFEWLGRADFTINSGGIKTQPEEVESKLAHPLKSYDIENFIVVGMPDSEYGERVTLVIESSSTFNTEALLSQLKNVPNDISNKKFPKSVVILEHLPRTASQKIDRRAIIRLISQKTNPNH